MESEIISFGLQILYTIGGGILGYFWNRNKNLEARNMALEQGMRATLKIELRRLHEAAVKRGYIDYNDEAVAEEIYQAYHALGGNGQGTKMIGDIRKFSMGGNRNGKAEGAF